MTDDIFDEPPKDPHALFAIWLEAAYASEPNDAEAMALATCQNAGEQDIMPNVRMVLLKGHDAHGFTFYSNMESQKAEELKTMPQAALCFHWKSLRRQVRVRGLIEDVSAVEADAYFASRGRASQLGAWSSQQSRPLSSYQTLQDSHAAFTTQFDGKDVPRPPHWQGRRVMPLAIEFWQDGAHRLHHRLLYTRPDAASAWQTQLLYP